MVVMIFILLNKFNLKIYSKFIKKHGHIMCQKYLHKIKMEINEFF